MIRQRFQQLLDALRQGVYEKDAELALSLLAALAGESVLLLGPPGVAKSMVARRIKEAFQGATSFEYLMSRFSTPDEIFGPVSISRLKHDDLYERNTQGFMPTADVVFLDEIWKAGPAILNTLLTIINEKTFRNGSQEVSVPLKLLIGASNELPAQGEGLEALWDRFLVRIVSGCVRNEENFYRIILGESEPASPVPLQPITPQEYLQWQTQIAQMPVGRDVLQVITHIRKHITALQMPDEDETAGRRHNIYVSDRRWQHIMRLLRASAFIHGRQQVERADLLVLVYCLWNEVIEIAPLRQLVVASLFQDCQREITRLKGAISTDVRRVRARWALDQSARENYHRDDNKQLFDGFNYRIDKFGTGNTYIFFVDYKNMKGFSRVNAPMEGVIYMDPRKPGDSIIRTMADSSGFISNGNAAQRVKLYRDDDNIYINGMKCPIHQLPPGAHQTMFDGLQAPHIDTDYDALIEQLADQVSHIADAILEGSMLISEDDRQEVQQQVKSINHQIALLRVESQKLTYDAD